MSRFISLCILGVFLIPIGYIIGCLLIPDTVSACAYDPNWMSLSTALDGCKPPQAMDSTSGGFAIFGMSVGLGDYSIAGGVKSKIISIANNIIVLGSLVAIGGIVFSGIHFLTAHGDEGKYKQASKGVVFALVGFAIMLLAFPIVNAVVNLVYKVGG